MPETYAARDARLARLEAAAESYHGLAMQSRAAGRVLECISYLTTAAAMRDLARGDLAAWSVTPAGLAALERAPYPTAERAADAESCVTCGGPLDPETGDSPICERCGTALPEPARYCGPACAAAAYADTATPEEC
jgi:hypothetical protein